jgi:hypothetical protein
MAVESGISLPTIIKWDKGGNVHDALAEKLTITAKRLGLLGKREAGR